MNNGKISLLHPSRGRPEKAKETFRYWKEQASNGTEIEHILSVDADDKKLLEYAKQDIFPLLINDNKSVVEATNFAASQSTGDILIYLSDDFKCPPLWDQEIIKRVKDKDLFLLKVNDGLQPFNVPVLTIPIMSRKLYEKLGYFFHPEYKSMFCDQQLFEICNKNGFIINAPELVFKHEHFINGFAEKDETYIRSNANWDQGLEVFNKHKEQGFPYGV